MANLTLTIDDDVLRRPRIRALERDTSVNAVVREFLASYAGASEPSRPSTSTGPPVAIRMLHRRLRDRLELAAGFLELAQRSRASSGLRRRTWRREGLYEERLGRSATR